MTTPVEETYVVVDADLDTADEEDVLHVKHATCQPGSGPAVAWCGTWMVAKGKPTRPGSPGQCAECERIWLTGRCPVCG